MSDRLRLVVFDVDGTLVDSQADIVSCMNAAFAGMDQPEPARADVLGLVGLSLDVLMPKLAPNLTLAGSCPADPSLQRRLHDPAPHCWDSGVFAAL